MITLKVVRVGSSTAVIIPEEMLTRLKLGEGDAMLVVETAHGYLLTPHNLEVEEELKIGREFMGEYCETFRALAK